MRYVNRVRFRQYLRWRPRTLRAQFLIYGAIVVLFTIAVATVRNAGTAAVVADRQTRDHMLTTATALARSLERMPPAEAQQVLVAAFGAAGPDAEEQFVWLVDLDGRVVAASEPDDVGASIEAASGTQERGVHRVLAGEADVTWAVMQHDGRQVLDLTVPLHGDPTDPTAVTGALHYDTVSYQSLTRRLLLAFAPAAVLVTVLLLVPLWFYLDRSLLRPLKTLMAADRAVAEGRPEARVIPEDAMPDHELGDAMRNRNAMLEQLETAERELRRRLREFSALNSTAALLSETLTPAELLGRTLEKVLEILDADAGQICLLESDGERLFIRAHRGFSAEWFAQERDRPTACLCGEIVFQEEPLCVPDIRNARWAERVTRPACLREGFRGYCAVPLRAGGEVLGVMSLHSRRVRHLPPPDRDLLAAIGSQVAIALLNIRLYSETKRLARTDPLTGLANRRVLQERLQAEIRRARRYEHPLALMMIDLDYFKAYNDTHGHPAGDDVLRRLAGLLQDAVRETDLVARYGGEEFVVLLPETDALQALEVAEKLRSVVEAYPFPKEETQPLDRITVSLGVAAYPEDGQTAKTIVQRADEALYGAKHAGRNEVCAARV